MILLLNAPADTPLTACPLLARLEASTGAGARVVHTGPLLLRTLGFDFAEQLAFVRADSLDDCPAEVADGLRALAVAVGVSGVSRVLLASSGPGVAGAFAEALRSLVDCPVEIVTAAEPGPASATYDSFLAQLAESGVSGRRPWLPFSAASGVAALDAMSARYKVLRFDLGVIGLGADRPAGVGFLSELAALRRDHLYGYEFRCVTGFDVTRDEAALLGAAGVTSVRLSLDSARLAAQDGADANEINARAVRSLRRLQDNDVEVRWLLAAAPDLRWLRPRAVSHLSPPRGVLALGGRDETHAESATAAQAASAWRAVHAPRKLTYGKGPGFVRVLDRRNDGQSMKFIGLTGAQSELYDACEDGATLATLSEVFPRLPAEKVGRFLDQLVGQDLLLKTRDGRYQTLALRRRLDERWTSAEQ